ncbi:hypothetical protein [Ferroplasma acidarmanus]|uniref:Uncharacterized protein n=1 Tax=Ferroplasma acidarmanus Fer1 TaxID=333146 RepID=S0AS76_FERAC|nr:hypothetical protein [Ferroplasma acidarmanus]AGO61831.1 hypothetical protein FACI_IFERC00001G1855 [Ferroplasma acidarmanus Fer1]
MKLSRIDTKLNKYFEIALNFKSNHLALSQATGYEGAGALFRDGDDLFFDFFILKSEDIGRLKPLFQLAEVNEREHYFLVREKMTDPALVEFFTDLDNINGLVISYAGIESGNMIIKGFMHENSEMDFSNLIYKYNYTEFNIVQITLKPSPGFYYFMKNTDTALQSIIVSLPVAEFSQYRVIKILKETNATVQFVDNNPIHGSFRAIIYSDRDLSSVENMTVISERDHIYETKTNDSILLLLASKAMSNNLTLNFMFLYVYGDRLVINFILPTYRAKDYFKQIIDTEIDLNNFAWLTLESYGPVNDGNMESDP